MLQKKNYITPPTRHASVIYLIDNQKPQLRTYLKKKKSLNAKRKVFYSNTLNTSLDSLGVTYCGVVTSYNYNKRPYQLMITVKSIYNNYTILPGMEGVIPGQQIFDLSKNCSFQNIFYLNSQIIIDLLPYHLFISSINNYHNSKRTFAKASGAFAIKLKAKKTVKLILVKLPSESNYFFLKNTKCFIGKSYNFFNNKFVEGKWGFSIHKKKTLHVRGVAMNPVDHPNGGRTKAKQPEKSPWGWIAKRNK